jgi:hypothetical protein
MILSHFLRFYQAFLLLIGSWFSLLIGSWFSLLIGSWVSLLIGYWLSLIHDLHRYDINQDFLEVNSFVLVEIREKSFDEQVQILLHKNRISKQVEQAFVKVERIGVVLKERGLARDTRLIEGE